MEFALVGPLLVLLLMGLVVYGGWFWLAQSVQHLASEGARAAVAGMDDDERGDLARAAVSGVVVSGSGFQPADLTVSVGGEDGTVRVDVTYDAADHPLMALSGIVPSPPRRITRSAIVRIGGG
ncbi:TadE/TadG family type IV pilus assembly protein [Brevundimonas sp.]|uniref:TadE/TadG family type IV pilus assembly protein n=1 Tax=Brevundimonas sp. TaxID=1871086 RepID=UPI002ABCC7C0|nr:TadE/TadG family type IV pilus assembly protein [Brevundimonas sp.]MDZ4363780.1 TadE/TadG family type IV pilus assembly protein [Brevundimonas sp.]